MTTTVLKSFSAFFALVLFFTSPHLCSADNDAPTKKNTPMAVAQKAMVKFFKSGDDVDFESARMKINKILRKEDSHIMAKVMLASLYQKKTDLLTEELLKADLKKSREIFQTGNVLLASRRYLKAIEYYDRLIPKYPKWACPMRHKAEALMNLDRNEEAVDVLKACLKVRKKHFDAYVFLARALVNCKRYEEALSTVNEAVKTFTPDDPCGEYGIPEAIMQDCNDLYFDIYTKMGKSEKAAKYKK